jgi:hypothetical protein
MRSPISPASFNIGYAAAVVGFSDTLPFLTPHNPYSLGPTESLHPLFVV